MVRVGHFNLGTDTPEREFELLFYFFHFLADALLASFRNDSPIKILILC